MVREKQTTGDVIEVILHLFNTNVHCAFFIRFQLCSKEVEASLFTMEFISGYVQVHEPVFVLKSRKPLNAIHVYLHQMYFKHSP